MNLYKLAQKSLHFYWRTNLAVCLSVIVAASVLTGALAVGDSVRYSLEMIVQKRLGNTQLALFTQNKFFRVKLADELAAELNTDTASVLQLRGLITNSDGTKRANKINVLGVNKRFFRLAEIKYLYPQFLMEEDRRFIGGITLNEPLAEKLGVKTGNEVVLRIAKPGLMPREAPLSPDSDLSVAFRLTVSAIAGSSQFGLFNLQTNQDRPLNVFVSLKWLQEKLDRTAQANILLVAENSQDNITVEKLVLSEVEVANNAIKKCWRLADAGLEFGELDEQGMLELRSNQIFIDETLAQAALNAADNSIGILTYFVNEIRLGDKVTPYSMVTAINSPLIPADMKDDEILINQWLADDLEAKVGDTIELTYYVLGPMRNLNEQKTTFRIRKILPMQGVAIDQELMPNYPGLADVNNCRDWEPGIPIDLDKIRKRDEDYWKSYRGTPKAFVTLKAGQIMWANRFGNLTAIRYASTEPAEVPKNAASKHTIEQKILRAIDPASEGLFFQPVRQLGTKASNEATDFGQLFLGFSLFLIIAALILTGLIFIFGVESRSEQTGLLLAVGFTPKLVKRLLLIEGVMLAVLGAIAGAAAGLLYTKALVYGLTTIWKTAVSSSKIYFYVKPSSLFLGASAAIIVSIIAIWLTLCKQVSRPARELLTGIVQWQFFTGKSASKGKFGLYVAIVAALSAAVILIFVRTGDSSTASAAFFAAGALLLAAGLGISHTFLKMAADRWKKPIATLAGLGVRNSTRRSGRSLAVIGLLACGIFMVIAVGANKHDPLANADRRNSGTGGFAMIGESAIGILQDLNSKTWRRSMGLNDSNMEGVKVVSLRVHDGDDASCLNLNRAQKPRLLAVRPEELQKRDAFKFTVATVGAKIEDGWNLLNKNFGKDVVPAVGDYQTIIWSLRKSVGEEIEYTDENGRNFHIRLVGMLRNSILQGSLVIAEDEFVRRFPSEDGFRMFLIDAPAEKAGAAADKFSFALRDFGMEFTPAKQRLAELAAVENTYLSIFQMLGGLGLILGSIGLAMVVLRNILDRRGEFAMLQAVGFDKISLKKTVFFEHWFLCLAGLLCGLVTALVAIEPALKSPGAEVPFRSLSLTVIAIAFSGWVWIRLATAFALSGKILDALRNE
jgi:putative ABC transport system permease protein